MGLHTVMAEVIGIGIQKPQNVLLLYKDPEYGQITTFKLPIQQLKKPEIPVKKTSACSQLLDIQLEYQQSLENQLYLLSRQTLLQFFSLQRETIQRETKLIQTFNLNILDIVRWSVLEELSYDPINAWLEACETHPLQI
jgi:hypothetical protein